MKIQKCYNTYKESFNHLCCFRRDSIQMIRIREPKDNEGSDPYRRKHLSFEISTDVGITISANHWVLISNLWHDHRLTYGKGIHATQQCCFGWESKLLWHYGELVRRKSHLRRSLSWFRIFGRISSPPTRTVIQHSELDLNFAPRKSGSKPSAKKFPYLELGVYQLDELFDLWGLRCLNFFFSLNSPYLILCSSFHLVSCTVFKICPTRSPPSPINFSELAPIECKCPWVDFPLTANGIPP
jgi:hypothetical protein